MDEEQDAFKALQELMQRHFAPAPPDAKDARILSTGDIFAIVDAHAPGVFNASVLYLVLRRLHYVDTMVGDELYWKVAPVKRS